MKRFWDRVNKTDSCWNWTGCLRGSSGYGCIKYQGKVYDVHRFAWYLEHGKWSNELVLHKCDNRICVNPDHLFEGTPKDNVQDAIAKGRIIPGKHQRKYFTEEDRRLRREEI